MKGLVIVGSISIFLLVNPCRISAADFSTHINTTITVKNPTTATVNQEIIITNSSDLRYPTGYTLILPGDNHPNLSITTANRQPLAHEITPQANTTKIKVKFPSPVLGIGKTQIINLDYQNPDILISKGNLIQLAIPPLITSDEAITSSTTVNLPITSCSNPETSISPSSHITTDTNQSLIFDRHAPHDSLFITCTTIRYVSAQLKYYLANPNMTPIETQITLPPDTAYQQFIFDRIHPEPLNIFLDSDGNTIASYKLEPKQEQNITVEARAMIRSKPLSAFPKQSHNKNYLSQQLYWPTHDSSIKKLASDLKDPKSLYRYILAHTSINPNRLDEKQQKRLGGKAIIDRPQEFLAPEFVDSFITLSRAQGIMSRRVVGYAETSNIKLRPQTLTSDSLHVWAEYFDTSTSTWVPVDPTWEVTSRGVSYFPIRDLNHLVLAINGYNDTNPYPVGYYHAPDNEGPDIHITDIESFTITNTDLKSTISLPLLTKLGLSNTANLILNNNSYHSLYFKNIEVKTNQTTLAQTTIDRLPLKSQVIIPITLPTKYVDLSISVDHEQPINLTRPKNIITTPTAIASCMAAAASVIAVITRRLLVSRRRA